MKALLLALALTGCSGMRLEGACTYTRTVTTAYQCQPDAHLEHYRVSPGGPEP